MRRKIKSFNFSYSDWILYSLSDLHPYDIKVVVLTWLFSGVICSIFSKSIILYCNYISFSNLRIYILLQESDFS